MTNYIILNKNNGVFIGTMWGLAFFSDCDPAGQIAVPSYKTKEQAEKAIAEVFGSAAQDYTAVEVEVAKDWTATKQECLAAHPSIEWVPDDLLEPQKLTGGYKQ